MSDQSVKQQISDKLKDVENVLVTVSSSPSVDELSAALGFTLLLNKLNKHATAVFSGAIPPAITFLDPERTFEDTVDSLRDFIIALDKEKADHLRYKVDGDMVKIFITPYRTVISNQDLEFTQGEYNVEMVVAIGVKNEDDLDRALADHGRIMHDATVASLSIRDEKSKLGSLNWHESEASSYSEMLISLSESLRNDKNLIDEQIATAFLTGIVAATERFSNDVTNSKVMTMAAQLMAAGANQQLIATKLEQANQADSQPEVATNNSDGTTDLPDNVLTKVAKSDNKAEPEPETKPGPVEDVPAADGTMKISHAKEGTLDEVAQQTAADNQAAAAKKAEEALAKTESKQPPAKSSEEELAASLKNQAPAANNLPSVADLQNDLEAAAKEVEQDAENPLSTTPELNLPEPAFIETPINTTQDEPMMGGTLNATTEQAADDKRRQIMEDRNRTILSHGDSQYVDEGDSTIPPVNSFNKAPQTEPAQNNNVLFDGGTTAKANPIQPLGQPETPPRPTLEELDRQNRGTASPLGDPQAAIEQALNMAPSLEQQQQTMPNMPSPNHDQTAVQPAPDLPPLPPMPDFSTLPPLPGDNQPPQQPPASLDSIIQPPAGPPPPPPASNDPSQFKIPS